ncbi:glycosyltransferase family 2 protein [Roseateles chitosanitabidus]|jgi:glycosyltransferase involved in cell wall biosynthesis|uniref:glycosyltransferase family 2 protein n=1 Tax=Roseateles chitosanitabidus TaxID=65048 RepID=UPI000829F2BA|nr:glycosyltransferase family A protein [Roseateles chitosanitabidus]
MSAPVPRFSVVIPLYNKEGQIGRALASVLGQTLQDFEVVVIDDGSKDNGPDVVAGIAAADPRVRLYGQANGGVSVARNRGVELARADVVAFLDGDDAWYPDHLERLSQLREAWPAAVAWAMNYHVVDLAGRLTPGVTQVREPRLLLTPENFFRIARDGTPVFSSAVAVDREALRRVGGFPAGVRLGEDLDTWIRLLFSGPIAFDARPGAYYHADGDERALTRHAPPARYVFFDTDEAWMRAHPEATQVARDMEEFHNFFRIAHAHHQIKWGDKAAGRAVLADCRTEAFAAERDRLLRASRLPQTLYRLMSRVSAVLKRRAEAPAAPAAAGSRG